MASHKNLAPNLPQVRKKRQYKNRKQELEMCWWTGDWRLFELLISCHYLCICLVCFSTRNVCVDISLGLMSTPHHLASRILPFKEWFSATLHPFWNEHLQKYFYVSWASYISQRGFVDVDEVLCVCIKTRDGKHMKMLWTNSWRDPHARIFSVQQCLERQQVMLVPVSIICILNEN